MRGLLDERETATLTGEVTAALRGAFGGIGTDTDPGGTGGIRGDYLPLSVDRAPLSQSLIADDPRLFQGSAALLGGPTVPTVPIATCFTSNAGWHTDQGPDVGGVKFLAHLERRTAGSGALRVIPGSHDPGFAARVRAYWSGDPALQGFGPSRVVIASPPRQYGDGDDRRVQAADTKRCLPQVAGALDRPQERLQPGDELDLVGLALPEHVQDVVLRPDRQRARAKPGAQAGRVSGSPDA